MIIYCKSLNIITFLKFSSVKDGLLIFSCHGRIHVFIPHIKKSSCFGKRRRRRGEARGEIRELGIFFNEKVKKSVCEENSLGYCLF